ncbi:MAG: ABC transporter permease [Niastella sp.]|nr:ABC transporter permease [Niastella sp.]
MKMGVNTEIAFTYLISRKKQTLVAALGVTFGISMFIFMNSLITGTNEYSEKAMLSATPHIRLYKDHAMSSASLLDNYLGRQTVNLIVNPQLVPDDNRIDNPEAVMQLLKRNQLITAMSSQVSANVLYSHGGVQENGNLQGVDILQQDKMFDISSTLVSGSVKALDNNPGSILIGVGLAERLNLQMGDHINITTSQGIVKSLQVAGIFKTTIKSIDNARSYCHASAVQQLLQRDRAYITDIFINIRDHHQAPAIGRQLEQLTGFTAESWQSNNETALAGQKIRNIIANSVVITILIVAGFGIYNILNMVIYEKIREIAILKATGFQGKDVIGIFIRQALFIGMIGAIAGMVFGWLISLLVSHVYIGAGNVTYLPVTFRIRHYVQGGLFGIATSFFAGYIPALRASKVDPVQIIRG